MSEYWIFILVGIILLSLILYNFSFMSSIHKQSSEDFKRTKEYGLKPLTRHPIIDHTICIVCGSCIRACPETHGNDSPLGIVDGRLLLVSPQKCVGHAACEVACPTGALTVSLGELAEDPNMPVLTNNMETIVPGIFIAGELSGVPLVKNAIEQGENVIKYIKNKTTPTSDIYDVIIVGIGPAGLSATLSAQENELNYLTLEQGLIGGTVANFPKQKMVMTSPVRLPLYGMLKKNEIQKEELMAIWNSLLTKHSLHIKLGEKVENIHKEKNLLIVKTATGEYKAQNVLLCLGRRGTPRKLGIPGEELSKVTYGLIDPDAYSNKDLLVVGGGDSAIEAAIVLSKNNRVTMSYRNEQFFRIKKKNEEKIKEAIEQKKVNVHFNSTLSRITEKEVTLKNEKNEINLRNDFIFVLIGGEPAFPLLRSAGILPEMKK